MEEEKTKKSNGFFKLMTLIMVAATLLLVFLGVINILTSKSGKTAISSAKNTEKSINVSIKNLIPEKFVQELAMNAEVKNLNGNVTITSPVSGTIVENNVRLGDRVSVGDVLGMIDASDVGLNYNTAPIISKVDGIVVASNAVVNQKIAAQTSLYIIQPESNFVLRATVSESDANTLSLGAIGYFTTSGDDKEHTCHLRYISPSVDANTRTVEIEADVDKTKENYEGLRSGNFVRLRLVKKEFDNVYVVPNDAVKSYMGQRAVYVVDSQNIARRKFVNVDNQSESHSIISGDLKVGDKIVVQGSPSDGASVKIL